MLTVDGDVSEPTTTDRTIGETLERFGRIDTLINNAGVFIAKPFTDYTAQDYSFVVGVRKSGYSLPGGPAEPSLAHNERPRLRCRGSYAHIQRSRVDSPVAFSG